MKKTYTACLFLVIGGLLYYGTLTGSGAEQCTRRTGLTSMHSNPSNCAAGCHGVIVNQDTIARDTMGGTGQGHVAGIDGIAYTGGIAVYPTFASDVVHIETFNMSRDMQYTIYSMDGRSMVTGSLPPYPGLTNVDIATLAPANYVIRIANTSLATTFRIIKK
ncbi:MAG: hypothetical protein JWO03_3123 [Bacteroidetes bacterium]|nr:hypothetical protein [Bacteroidota bacterium]